MIKYVVAIICFCLFFLVPMKDMKNDIKSLEEDKFFMLLEIDEKDKIIDSLGREIVRLKKIIDIKKEKPIIKKKPIFKKIEPIEIPIQIENKDSL